MTRIKICGITSIEDALAAVDAGADALGFNFAAGPRKIEPALAREIIAHLPPFVTVVGVFIREDPSVAAIADGCGVRVIQLHGGESEGFARSLWPRPVIRVIHASDEGAIQAIPSCASAAAILLDASVAGKLGGTGRTFDWDIAVRAKKYGKPIILAGGLNPGNVAAAVAKVRPYAVDVASGVESSPGKKDCRLVREFIDNVRAFD